MDWSRAKTYLIITFLLLDMLLGYQYYSAQQKAQGYIQPFSVQMEELQGLLTERKMVLQTEVPKETPEMSFLQVSRPKRPTEEVVEKLFDEARLIEDDKSTGTMTFHTEQGEFRVTGQGFYTLQLSNPIPVQGGADTKTSQLVRQAIGPLVNDIDLYREDLFFGSGKNVVFRYQQTYDEYPLFSGLLEVQLQNGGIIRYNQKALTIGDEDSQQRRVLSAINAVRSVAETFDPSTLPDGQEQVFIRSIELGYYSPNYEDADEWYLAPMWRIVTDQHFYYVNAFTGQVESGMTP
ncbi:MAG TPA: two-component system regulatory protein YycI [Bacilli bacterium]|nr:two-component system regulatory protein YycI [Bacilli bacterium]